ncbi:CE1759 family FMN reductase [Corynebacterium sp. H113]|uniref:CE1759 family FMN reductase n=1 Tax=Corynebacterium sp. H113 TaxID=3133419 RepID=UPI00309E58BE
MHKIVVISSGLSTPSTTRQLADMLSNATSTAISARGENAEIHVIELRTLARDLADLFTAGGIASAALDDARNRTAAADAIIAVTPVFKASYNGLFKMFIDSLDDDALRNVPILLGATAGTARHSLVIDHTLRPLFSHFGARIAPTDVFSATDDFGESTFTGDLHQSAPLAERAQRAGRELAEMILTTHVDGLASTDRPSGAGLNTSGVSFTDLLADHSG